MYSFTYEANLDGDKGESVQVFSNKSKGEVECLITLTSETGSCTNAFSSSDINELISQLKLVQTFMWNTKQGQSEEIFKSSKQVESITK